MSGDVYTPEPQFDMVRVGWECPACGRHHSSLLHRYIIGRHDTFEACPNHHDAIITIYTSELDTCTVCGQPILDDDSHSTDTGYCHSGCCKECP